MEINPSHVLSAFLVIFVLIGIFVSMPIMLGFTSKGQTINAGQASLFSLILLVVFLFMGKSFLHLFHIDIASFALAGSIIIFFVAFEMIFGVSIFKADSPTKSVTIIPVVFPLIAGPGTLSALLSLNATYNKIELLIAIIFNIVIVYAVLRYMNLAQQLLGEKGIYVLRKFFGIILMSLAIKIFTTNIDNVLNPLN